MSSSSSQSQYAGTIMSSNVIAIGTPGPAPPPMRNINWTAAPKRTGVTIERNIVHGSEAWVLSGKKDRSGPPSAGDGDETSLANRAFAKSIPNANDTHRWRVYLRALNPKDDLTHFIKEVTFELHESFVPNKVTICAPPYEVEATGWGEFDIHMTVSFHDTTEAAVEFDHMLKLFAPDSALPKKGRSIISEHHDQIFFTDPSEPLYQALMANPPSAPPTTPLQDDGGFHDEDTLDKIIASSDRVKDEIARIRGLYEAQVREATELRMAIEALQQEEQNRHLATTNRS
jgi:YEATS domain-containing protein 4